MIWIITVLTTFAFAKGPARNKPFQVKMTKTGTCKPVQIITPAGGDASGAEPMAALAPTDKKVMVLKQWHLAPTTVTKGFKEKYKQEKNQTAIYRTLSEMVKKKQLEVIVAEGCEGEIDRNFETAFNGWKIEDLAKQAQTKGFEKIVAHVPMKVEARWGDKVVTLCGDDEKLIKESQLHLSNLRGWMGFWNRFSDSKPEDGSLKLYSDAAADLLKVSKDTSIEELKKKINQRSLEELALFEQSLNDRNASFVKALNSHDFKTAAVVVGGLHASDLKLKLEQAGLACDIYEPPGYSREDENLIKEFADSLKN